MQNRPSGTVTFLFTDIEGSTQLWERQPDAMQRAFKRQEQIIRDAVAARDGYAYKMVGDAFQIAFANTSDAIAAAVDAQRALHAENWDAIGEIKVRMALHSGVTEERGDDYVGPALNRAARLGAAGHGGQILLSQTTFDLVRDILPDGTTIRDLGEHRLRDLIRPERIYQLLAPALPTDFPPLKTLDARPNNLPVQLTSFIGRAREMAQVKELLERTRLLTLLGVGGTGKTRLALEVAADLLENYRDGVWLVELAPLSDPVLVPQAIASVLSVREEHGRPMLNTLSDHLRNKNLLLILDNCEHLIDACARAAEAILRACSDVKVLATSREALGISGELVWRVPSLTLPNINALPPLETLAQYEAIRLFTERASLAVPSFALAHTNAPLVAQICYRLDGIPLAIELAAARIKALSVEQIAARLDDRFRLLTGGSRTALPRQQTLQSLIDWSHDLLDEKERVVFRRLSAFASGWTLDAAEEVVGQDNFLSDDVLEFLSRLVDKSLVIVEQPDSESRYRMLDTIRQYARGKLLESGEAERVRTRHAEFFLKLAEEAEPKLRGGEQLVWLNRLEEEHDNLRAALDWLLGCDPFKGLWMAGALFWFWRQRDHWKEASAWLERALASTPALENIAQKQSRAKALDGAMWMARDQSDHPAAQSYFEQVLALYRELDDTRGLGDCELYLGLVAWHSGEHPVARTHLEKALALFRAAKDPFGAADAIHLMGHVESDLARYVEARTRFETSLAQFRELGDSFYAGVLMSDLGLVAYLQQDDAAAEKYLRASLELGRQTKSREVIASSLNRLGDLARLRGDHAQATALYQETLQIFRELGEKVGVASALHNLAHVAQSQEEFERARALVKESLQMNRELENKAGISECLAAFAEIAAAEGKNAEPIARLFGAAEELGGFVATFHWPANRIAYDRAMKVVRAQLSETRLNALLDEGRAMTADQAMEYALQDAS